MFVFLRFVDLTRRLPATSLQVRTARVIKETPEWESSGKVLQIWQETSVLWHRMGVWKTFGHGPRQRSAEFRRATKNVSAAGSESSMCKRELLGSSNAVSLRCRPPTTTKLSSKIRL
jgi:hypothetical protein